MLQLNYGPHEGEGIFVNDDGSSSSSNSNNNKTKNESAVWRERGNLEETRQTRGKKMMIINPEKNNTQQGTAARVRPNTTPFYYYGPALYHPVEFIKGLNGPWPARGFHPAESPAVANEADPTSVCW